MPENGLFPQILERNPKVKTDWPLQQLQVGKNDLVPMSEKGHSIVAFKIIGGEYRGNVLKTMITPPDDRFGFNPDLSLNIVSTMRNAEALSRLQDLDTTKVSKLIARGVYDQTLATVETLMPDILGNRTIISTMKTKTQEQRYSFYKSLTDLFVELKRNGVIPRDSNNDFAFHPDNSAGMVDFGSSYIVDGSYNSPGVTELSAEKNSITVIASLVDFVEDFIDNKGFDSNKRDLIRREHLTLENLREALNSL